MQQYSNLKKNYTVYLNWYKNNTKKGAWADLANRKHTADATYHGNQGRKKKRFRQSKTGNAAEVKHWTMKSN